MCSVIISVMSMASFKKCAPVISIVVTMLIATPASAYTITVGGQAVPGEGLSTSVAGASVIDFNAILSLPNGYIGGLVVNGDLSGQWASPPGDTSNYLTVGAGEDQISPSTVTLITLNKYFGFYGGSPDSYNSIELRRDDVLLETFTGDFLATQASLAADGNQSNGAYWNIWADNADEYFNKVSFVSSANAFETDNHAYLSAVPIPAAAWLFGSALLGIIGFSRRKIAS